MRLDRYAYLLGQYLGDGHLVTTARVPVLRALLRGLIHSDGCRSVNRVVSGGRPYEYPRYLFANESGDILRICGDALDPDRRRQETDNDSCSNAESKAPTVAKRRRDTDRQPQDSLSVARRGSVARLDAFIGPKT